jgi:plasmid stabilization system protein ParE
LAEGGRIGHAASVDGYRALRSGSHMVFYREEGDTLFIARVLHQAMHATRHLSPNQP